MDAHPTYWQGIDKEETKDLVVAIALNHEPDVDWRTVQDELATAYDIDIGITKLRLLCASLRVEDRLRAPDGDRIHLFQTEPTAGRD